MSQYVGLSLLVSVTLLVFTGICTRFHESELEIAMLEKPSIILRSSQTSNLKSGVAIEYFENYIPVYVGPVPQRILSPRIVLRFVGDLSLTELEFCATSGRFSSLSVITYRDRIQEMDSQTVQDFLQIDHEGGTPEFEITNLPAPTGRLQNIFDYHFDVSLNLGADSIRIDFAEPKGELQGKFRMSDSCFLGFDENKRLCCIWLFQLDTHHREEFEALQRDFQERRSWIMSWATRLLSALGR